VIKRPFIPYYEALLYSNGMQSCAKVSQQGIIIIASICCGPNKVNLIGVNGYMNLKIKQAFGLFLQNFFVIIDYILGLDRVLKQASNNNNYLQLREVLRQHLQKKANQSHMDTLKHNNDMATLNLKKVVRGFYSKALQDPAMLEHHDWLTEVL